MADSITDLVIPYYSAIESRLLSFPPQLGSRRVRASAWTFKWATTSEDYGRKQRSWGSDWKS